MHGKSMLEEGTWKIYLQTNSKKFNLKNVTSICFEKFEMQFGLIGASKLRHKNAMHLRLRSELSVQKRQALSTTQSKIHVLEYKNMVTIYHYSSFALFCPDVLHHNSFNIRGTAMIFCTGL